MYVSYGRRMIFTDATKITTENVVGEVEKAMNTHDLNRADTEKLYQVYCGQTDILSKKKEIREDINHKINEAHPYEIVTFHKGYCFGEAIQYIRRENSSVTQSDDEIAEDINALNGYMVDADKAANDNEIAEWFMIGGTSYRLTLPNKAWSADGDEPPFTITTLDPRQTCVVYHNGVHRKPMMGIYEVLQGMNERIYSVYTDEWYFEIRNGVLTSAIPNPLGMIPITEYPADNARLGFYEIVMPLINALDELQSNRMDDIVQTVNSFLAIFGAELDKGTYADLNEYKTLCLPEGSDAKYLNSTLSQNDVQTLKDDLYQTILTICGVPNRNGSASSTSDTGQAVQLRNGWELAESRAKATELIFKRSEKNFLKLILRILRDTVGTKLKLTDIEIHFTRRNYENIATKAQVLTSMLSNPNIHPELAFAYCGMFVDPESAYLQSMEWRKEQEQKEAERLANSGRDQMSSVQSQTGVSKRSGEDQVS